MSRISLSSYQLGGIGFVFVYLNSLHYNFCGDSYTLSYPMIFKAHCLIASYKKFGFGLSFFTVPSVFSCPRLPYGDCTIDFEYFRFHTQWHPFDYWFYNRGRNRNHRRFNGDFGSIVGATGQSPLHGHANIFPQGRLASRPGSLPSDPYDHITVRFMKCDVSSTKSLLLCGGEQKAHLEAAQQEHL
jgi:hypothetical protein